MDFSSELQMKLQKQKVKFRAMLIHVCEKMDDKDVERLGFLYGIERSTVESNKALYVMDSLVRSGDVRDEPDYLLQFKEVLTDELHKKELGDIVDRYINVHLEPRPPMIHSTTSTTNDVPTPVAEQVSARRVYHSPQGLIEDTTEGKGTDIGFSSIDDEHSIVDSGSTTSGIETSDSHFMDKAQAVALEESEDHLTKVGAVIVQNNEVIGTGANRMPNNCRGKFPLDRKGPSPLDTKYPYIIHAAILAIINALKEGKCLAGATVYTTLFPGNVDAQLMVECGIKEVVYRDNLYPNQPYIQAATKIFQEGGVGIRSMQIGGVHRRLTFGT